MLNAQFRPLVHWPGERTRSRKSGQFRSTYLQTLDLLEYELGKLKAKDIIVQVDNLTLNDIKNDGWPKLSWCPRGGNQGVVISFESPKGPLSFPCDTYTDWKDNLRAIGMSLEALRSVDRYGVTRGNEQYKGWSKLPDPNANGKMDREEALLFMAGLTATPKDFIRDMNQARLLDLFRAAKGSYHPDHGTDDADRKSRHETFVRIGQAQEVLCGAAS